MQVVAAVNDSEARDNKTASGTHWSTLVVFRGGLWSRVLRAAGYDDRDGAIEDVFCAVHCDSHAPSNASAAAQVAEGLRHLLCDTGASRACFRISACAQRPQLRTVRSLAALPLQTCMLMAFHGRSPSARRRAGGAAHALPVLEARVPQQQNCSDCGVFVLAFTRRLCALLAQSLDGAPPPPREGAGQRGAHGALLAMVEAALAEVESSMSGLRREVLQLVEQQS